MLTEDLSSSSRIFILALALLRVYNFSDRIALGQILVRVVDMLDRTEERLRDRVFVFESCLKSELVADCSLPFGEIGPGANVELVEHVVIEVIFVWSDARLLKRIYRQSCSEVFDPVHLRHKCVHIRGVGGWIEGYQRCIHVAGCRGTVGCERQRG